MISMIDLQTLTISYGKKVLVDSVNAEFAPGSGLRSRRSERAWKDDVAACDGRFAGSSRGREHRSG